MFKQKTLGLAFAQTRVINLELYLFEQVIRSSIYFKKVIIITIISLSKSNLDLYLYEQNSSEAVFVETKVVKTIFLKQKS